MVEYPQPLYVLPQKKTRAILPKIFTLLILSIIFYLGVLLNLSLLELNLTQENLIKTTSIIIVTVVVILGILFAFINSRKTYHFYQQEITFGKKELLYGNITNIQLKEDLFDKIFKTYSLKLTDQFSLKNIPTEVPIQNYLQQLVSYQQR